VNDLNQLVRLDNRDGSVIWRVALPDLIERRAGKSRAAVAHYGPILAGGRLIVASSDGLIRQFDPVSGAMVGQIELSGGAASAPVVAGNTLYVVSKNGQLLAFR
jgi:outer membrane protein assembly factor BamB